MKSLAWGGGGSRSPDHLTSRPPRPSHVLHTCPDPLPSTPAPRGLWERWVPLHPVSASFPEIKGGWRTYLLYLLLVIILPILVFLGLKIHLPWR